MIRAASLRGFGPLVTGLGGDVPALMSRCGIDPSTLDLEDALIPISWHDRMLDLAAKELCCPDLGLRLARIQDLSILGPLAFAIGSSATVEEALDCLSRFLFVHSPALSIGLQPDPFGVTGVVAVTYSKDLSESPYSPQGIELGVGVLYRAAKALLGDDLALRSVLLPHPPQHAVESYTEFFGVQVRFDAPIAALRATASVVEQAFLESSPRVREAAIDHLASTYRDPRATFVARVRTAVIDTFNSGSPTVTRVALALGLHQRTLQRRLALEGTTFSRIVDDARRDTAARLLTMTALPISQVALMVGFSEQSSLTHASGRWFGASPRAIRHKGGQSGIAKHPGRS